MRTLPVTPKNVKAFYCVLFDRNGILGKVDGTIYFFAEDGEIVDYEPDMANFCTVLGQTDLAETQQLLDRLHGGAAWIATHRLQEVA
jgi:hypothetical protein